MFAIIGILVVFGAIIGGYMMEHGNLMVLMQPAEFLIIGGAALGTILVANPLPIMIAMLKGLLGILKPSRFTRTFYLEQLKMLNAIFVFARKNGMARLEADVDDPAKSRYPMPLDAAGKDEVFVGRIREDSCHANTLDLWCVADNIRKGAATNAIQIAEKMIEMGLVK